MTTFDSFCERCGQPAQPSAAPARGPRTGLLRALVGRRNEPAPEPALRLCFSCRGYVCANCWNDAAGQCQGCVPIETVASAATLMDDGEVELGPIVVPTDGPYPDTFDQSWPVSDLSRQGLPYWPAVAEDEELDDLAAAQAEPAVESEHAWSAPPEDDQPGAAGVAEPVETTVEAAAKSDQAWYAQSEPWLLLSPVAMSVEPAAVEDEAVAEASVDEPPADAAEVVVADAAEVVVADAAEVVVADVAEAVVADVAEAVVDASELMVADAGEVAGAGDEVPPAEQAAALAEVARPVEVTAAPVLPDAPVAEGVATTAPPLGAIPAPDELLWEGLLETAPTPEQPTDMDPEPDPRDIARAFRSRRLRRRSARPVRAAFRQRAALNEPPATAEPIDDSSAGEPPVERTAEDAATGPQPEQNAFTAPPQQVPTAVLPTDDVLAGEDALTLEPVPPVVPPVAPTPPTHEPATADAAGPAADVAVPEKPAEQPSQRPSQPVVMPAPPRTLKLPPAHVPMPPLAMPAPWTTHQPPPVAYPPTEPLPTSIIPPPARFRPHQPTMSPLQSAAPAVLPCANCGLTLSTKVSFCRRCGTRQQPTA